MVVSTDGCGINPTPRVISNLGCGTNSSIVIQYGCEYTMAVSTAQWCYSSIMKLHGSTSVRRPWKWGGPWGKVALGPGFFLAWQLCSLLFCSACSLPVLVRHLWCSAPAEETQSFVFSLWWKGKVCSLSQGGVYLHRWKSPSLVPDWFVLMQMETLNPWSLIGSKDTVLIDQNGAAVIGWWRCWCGYSCTVLIGQGKP